jgi:hypothetical protein
MGWGANIQNSENVIFDNNTIYNFRPIGLGVDFSTNISIINNIMIGVLDRGSLNIDDTN